MSKDIQQQNQLTILLIGEVCKDVYVFGDVERLSPEAPVPVLKKTIKEYRKGMAGNVYENLKSMTLNTAIDFYSNDINNIKKIRFIENKSKYQIMRYDIEKTLTPFSLDSVKSNDYDAVVLSDYNKGFLDDSTIRQLCKKFKNTPFFVDSKRKDMSCFEYCILKINESERNNCHNIKSSVDVITTLGANGCYYKENVYDTKKVDVHDVCGAGDVFLASLVVAWLENKDIETAIKVANECASLSVTKQGCYSVKRGEYENATFNTRN